jgi:hypothetical protein
VTMKRSIFWNVIPCISKGNRRFVRIRHFRFTPKSKQNKQPREVRSKLSFGLLGCKTVQFGGTYFIHLQGISEAILFYFSCQDIRPNVPLGPFILSENMFKGNIFRQNFDFLSSMAFSPQAN